MTRITVEGAREHNLRNIDLSLPRNALTVITGPSGSGKSSLAFDTLYAESQRLFVEALSPYARQLLGQLPRPDVDRIEGLSPAIALRQNAGQPGPRSTVGTLTEVLDFLRVLYARVGVVHCPSCDAELKAESAEQIVDNVLRLPPDTRLSLLAPLGVLSPSELRAELDRLRSQGFVRVRLGGETCDLSEPLASDREASLDVVIDRIRIKSGVRTRLNEAVEMAANLTGGRVRVVPQAGEEQLFTTQLECTACGLSFGELSPASFSFNAPAGACTACGGLGHVYGFDEAHVVPDPTLSLRAGAIAVWGRPESGAYTKRLKTLRERIAVSLDKPWGSLTAAQRQAIMHGKPAAGGKEAFAGVLPTLTSQASELRVRRGNGLDEETHAELEQMLRPFARTEVCGDCEGSRLSAMARAVRVSGLGLVELLRLDLQQVQTRLADLSLGREAQQIAAPLLADVRTRVAAMLKLGLGYLSLERAAPTLSAGELQRIRMVTQVGSGLLGVLYVLDEPSSGLHPSDTARLIETLCALRDRGNTVLVVEHDDAVLRAADHVVDLGPGAGAEGGALVAQGTPEDVERVAASPTGAVLRGEFDTPRDRPRRAPRSYVALRGARTHNLCDVDVDVPVGVLCCVTGVSGSGKSSLILDSLLPAVRQVVADREGGSSALLSGAEVFDRVLEVDQAPIGRSPRSNPASYLGVYQELREIYAKLPAARTRGFGSGRFSFNVRGGRCDVCQGAGVARVAMHFLPDMWVRCEACQGSRFNRETLEVTYRGHNIAEVLALRVRDAVAMFDSHPSLHGRLNALMDVGLGYLSLGQRASTLSGGEAQRIKLARELARKATGNTLLVFDEPTSGLHAVDVRVLLGVFDRLVDAGNTVLVIEHHPLVMRSADYLIDMGPGAGPEGGRVVAVGTPEQVAAHPGSRTAPYLRFGSPSPSTEGKP